MIKHPRSIRSFHSDFGELGTLSTQQLWMWNVLHWFWVIRIALARRMWEGKRLCQFWAEGLRIFCPVFPSLYYASSTHHKTYPSSHCTLTWALLQEWDVRAKGADGRPKLSHTQPSQTHEWDISIMSTEIWRLSAKHHHDAITRLIRHIGKNCPSKYLKHLKSSAWKSLNSKRTKWSCGMNMHS